MSWKADLHIHTVRSDGGSTAEQVFSFARSAGLDCISITDHDVIGDFAQYRSLSEQYGVRVLPGTEISAYDWQRHRRVHILAYGNPDGTEALQSICDFVCSGRRSAGEAMTRLVMERYPITMEDVNHTARQSASIFKQHILQTLMHAGFATELYGSLWKELFHSRTGSCICGYTLPDVWEVLRSVRDAGYVCIMAHPFTYDSIDLLQELTDAGLLDGIEVWQSKTDPGQEETLLRFAEQHHLIPTGGSDYHGMFASCVAPLGAGLTPLESLQAIEERLHARNTD